MQLIVPFNLSHINHEFWILQLFIRRLKDLLENQKSNEKVSVTTIYSTCVCRANECYLDVT